MGIAEMERTRVKNGARACARQQRAKGWNGRLARPIRRLAEWICAKRDLHASRTIWLAARDLAGGPPATTGGPPVPPGLALRAPALRAHRAGVRRQFCAASANLLAFVAMLGSAVDSEGAAPEQASVIVAIGAFGGDDFKGVFERWAEHWKSASAAGDAKFIEIAGAPNATDSLTRLRDAVQAEPRESAAPLWLVLLGHGTFDGKEPKFNLRGDDLAASALAEGLRPFKRPPVVVCGFSASGAFLKPLSAPDRVIVCATRSGSENNFARFGGYFSECIADPAADLDKDGETSVLEAWLAAARRTADFY